MEIAFDGVFVLDFRKVHLLCVPQLEIKNLSLTEVRDFYARTIALFFPVYRENEQKPYGVRVL